MSWFTDYQEKMENEWDQFQMIMDDLREWHLYGDLDEDDFREKVEDNTEVLGQVVGELVFETLEEHNFGLPAAGPPPKDGVSSERPIMSKELGEGEYASFVCWQCRTAYTGYDHYPCECPNCGSPLVYPPSYYASIDGAERGE